MLHQELAVTPADLIAGCCLSLVVWACFRFGFVVYKTREAAANAVEHLNGKSIPDLSGPAAERKVSWTDQIAFAMDGTCFGSSC